MLPKRKTKKQRKKSNGYIKHRLERWVLKAFSSTNSIRSKSRVILKPMA